MLRNIMIRDERGALLISLIATMVIMAILGTGMLYYSTTSAFGELLQNRQMRAYYLGESGTNYALQQFLAHRDIYETNGPFYPGPETFTLDNGQISVKTYDHPSDSNRLIIESTGIVGSGWLATRQLVVKNILKASATLPGQSPTESVDFDLTVPTGTLDPTWTETPGTNTDIVDTGPSGEPALLFRGDTSSINLAWNTPAGQAAGAPDLYAAWLSNGNLLSYTMQVKVKIEAQGAKGQNYLVGLSFRKINTDSDFYGLSFYRSARLNPPSGLPAWCTSAFTSVIPNDGQIYAVFWKDEGGTKTVLAYALMSYGTYGVTTDATNQRLSDWSGLYVRVTERFDGTDASVGNRRNHFKFYVSGLGASAPGTPITWIWTSNNLNPQPQNPPITDLIEDTFTSVTDSTHDPKVFEETRPEISVQAYYDQNASQDQFFSGFGMTVQGTSTGSGGYQY